MEKEVRLSIVNFLDHGRQIIDGNPLAEQIRHFDANWQQEGLPYDWFNLDEVGFSIKKQMMLLKGKDFDSKSIWIEQTRRDILGFGLEYLRKGTIFPFEYTIVEEPDGTRELIEERYGNRKMLDTISQEERNGSVLESWDRTRKHLISKDGTWAAIVSPNGWTGLKTDRGKEIIYEDTQVYFVKRTGNKVVGTTLRTDFSLKEARAVIKILTGKTLPENASVADYVRTVAFSNEDEDKEKLVDVEDVIFKLQKARKDHSGEQNLAYKEKSWKEMLGDLRRREFLYEFDEKVHKIIEEFDDYIMSRQLSRHEIQKALATTILRISKYELVAQTVRYSGGIYQEDKDYPYEGLSASITYGEVLEEVRKLPGCAGGGNSSSVLSITDRLTISKNRGYEFNHEGTCVVCNSGPKLLGPCEICEACTIEIERKEMSLAA